MINKFVAKHNNCFGAWASIITVISLPIILFQLSDILTNPIVEIEFVHPESVAYKVQNHSSRIAEDVLVSFGIFDIDAEPPIILPIPADDIEYVNPKLGKGPFTLFGKYGTKGHRYFGIVYVGCKGCENLNTYWLYVKHGVVNESFYAKRTKKDTYAINPSQARIDEGYLQKLVPETRRIYIRK